MPMTQPTYSLVHISHVVDECSLADLSLLTISLKQEVHLYSKAEFDTAVNLIARRIIFLRSSARQYTPGD